MKKHEETMKKLMSWTHLEFDVSCALRAYRSEGSPGAVAEAQRSRGVPQGAAAMARGRSLDESPASSRHLEKGMVEKGEGIKVDKGGLKDKERE